MIQIARFVVSYAFVEAFVIWVTVTHLIVFLLWDKKISYFASDAVKVVLYLNMSVGFALIMALILTGKMGF